jgi:[ribosomal protein S5]-alanine N-acetyltransferase
MLPLRERKYSWGGYTLRRLTADDVTEKYLSWMRDAEVTEYLQARHASHDLPGLVKYVQGFSEGNSREIFGVYADDTGEHIGNASVYNVDYHNGTFDFGYFIGEKSYWGKGPGLAVCLIILHICFDELGLRKVFTYVESKNLRSRFVLQKIGFVNEATLKDRVRQGDEYIDSVVYGLSSSRWKEECFPKFFI